VLTRMSLQRLLWFYLWIGPHVLLLVVAIVMFRKARHKEFPIFFSYLLFEFFQFAVLFTMFILKPPSSIYSKMDLFGRAGSIALHFGIIQEMFHSPVLQAAHLRKAAAGVLKWVTVFLILLSAVFIGSIYYSTLGYRILQDYVSIEAFNTAQCGLLVLVFLWHRFLGIRMSPMVFGMAIGMGLVAGLEPLLHLMKEFVPAQSSRMVDFVQFASFHGAVLLWLYFAQRREVVHSIDATFLVKAPEWSADLGRITRL
jgi:hypothetical protein